jgi:hypothetical protein
MLVPAMLLPSSVYLARAVLPVLVEPGTVNRLACRNLPRGKLPPTSPATGGDHILVIATRPRQPCVPPLSAGAAERAGPDQRAQRDRAAHLLHNG